MIFIDTNAFIALTQSDEEFYQPANDWWKSHTSESFITSNLIVIETLGWIRYKNGKRAAIAVGKRVLYSDNIVIERITNIDEQETWELFQKLNGRGTSMIDCTSFILMKRLKIKDIFTFDQDFKRLGFRVYPS